MNFTILMLNMMLKGAQSSKGGFWAGFVGFLSSILEGIYHIIPNYGVAVIIFTVLIRLALLPLDLKSKKSMQKMNEIQPEVDKINQKYKNDPEKRNKKTMELYQKNKINPAGGCLPVLIQFPILIAMFSALRRISDAQIAQNAVQSFLWIKNIWAPDSPMVDIFGKRIAFFTGNWNGLFILPLLAGITSYYQIQLTNKQNTNAQANEQMGMMNTIMPIMSIWFCSMYTSAFSLYWVASNIFQIVYMIIYDRKNNKEKENTVVKEGANK
ncbi:MAG: membrane protein insertase YidC [Xylanivirga thermophila]|jgi:YidC/Oxa1 family membrane protein insertase|uniref:YidC/Oxa1 family membrane protein insertase n=1 Tax=Xylanivirga thermophila TaxID=2496273 RepID=UPI0039F4A91C